MRFHRGPSGSADRRTLLASPYCRLERYARFDLRKVLIFLDIPEPAGSVAYNCGIRRDSMRTLTWLITPQALSNAHRLQINRAPTPRGHRTAINRVKWSRPDDKTSRADRNRENVTAIQE